LDLRQRFEMLQQRQKQRRPKMHCLPKLRPKKLQPERHSRYTW
jgi:hypothetical protein